MMSDRTLIKCLITFLWLKLIMVAVVLIGYGMAHR